MNANDYGRSSSSDGFDMLVEHLETESGEADMERLDEHWTEVMKLAEKHGFIVDAGGGVAVICTHEEYVSNHGIENEANRLRAQCVEMGGDEQ